MEQQSPSSTQQKKEKTARTMADITPLEPSIDSFSTSIEQADDGGNTMGKGEVLPSLQTHTPPETPELPHVSTIAANAGDDPYLFPDSPLQDRTRSLSPLIKAYDNLDTRSLLERRIDRNEHPTSSERFRGSSFDLHRQTESSTYPAILGIRNAQDAIEFHRSCVEEQLRWRRELALPPLARSAKASQRDVTSTQQVSRLNRSAGISKPRSVSPRPIPRPVATATASAPRAHPHRASTSHKKKAAKSPKAVSEGPSEASNGQKKHTRAAPTKNVTQQQWTEIEDVTPPLSVLDGKTHEPKWDGNMRDISQEPDVEHLHELERRWASRLRLEPQQYLATKRLIFKERLAYLRAGKNFTKTAAQGVAKLDVNKLSRLHSAFDAVGWFDEKYFQQYLQPVASQ